jgi:hypothetical protein
VKNNAGAKRQAPLRFAIRSGNRIRSGNVLLSPPQKRWGRDAKQENKNAKFFVFLCSFAKIERSDGRFFLKLGVLIFNLATWRFRA